MHKIACLFSSPQELEAAIQAIAQADLGDVDTEVIDNVEDQGTQILGAPVTNVNPSVQTPAPALLGANNKDYIMDRLDIDEDEGEFLARGLEHGATIYLVEVDDEHRSQALAILREHNANIFEAD